MTQRLLNEDLIKRGLRVFVPLMVPLIVIFVVYVYREMQLLGLPDIGDPFDVEAFANVQIPDEENAYVEYERAAIMLWPATYKDSEYRKAIASGWDAAPENIREWIAKNSHALELWQKGTEKSDALPKEMRSFEPRYKVELRNICRTIPLKCREIEQRGDFHEAWIWNRALFRCGRHMGMHSGPVGVMTGYAFQSVAAHEAIRWSRSKKVEESLLTEALKDVTLIYQTMAKPTDTLKWSYVESVLLLKDWNTRVDSWDNLKEETKLFLGNERELYRRIHQHAFAQAYPEYVRFEQINNISRGQTEKATEATNDESVVITSDLTAAELDSFARKSLIGSPIRLYASRFHEVICLEQFRQRALEIALAAQIYRRRHGRYPDSIEQIVSILEQAGIASPRDPFSEPGSLLRYRLDEQHMVIWTVGEYGETDPDQFPETDGLPVSGWIPINRTVFIPLDVRQDASPAVPTQP